MKNSLDSIRKMLGKLILLEDRGYNSIFHKAAEMQSAVPLFGDYLEFGVFQGKSFIQAYKMYERWLANTKDSEAWNKMRFIAFDSFLGVPEPSDVDLVIKSFKGRECYCSRERFEENLRSNGIDMSKVVIVEGWYDSTLKSETAKSIGLSKVAFAHIDCDLYYSSRLALEFITPFLINGSVVAFDDWYLFGRHPELGQQRAFSEWLNSNPDLCAVEFHKEATFRNSFILNKKGLANQIVEDRNN